MTVQDRIDGALNWALSPHNPTYHIDSHDHGAVLAAAYTALRSQLSESRDAAHAQGVENGQAMAVKEIDRLRSELAALREEDRLHTLVCPQHVKNVDPWVRESALKAAEARLAEVTRERDDYHKKACEIADQRDHAETRAAQMEKERDEQNANSLANASEACYQHDRAKKAEAEVERLKSENACQYRNIEKAQAEIERLKAEVASAKELTSIPAAVWQQRAEHHMAESAAKDKEIERMTAQSERRWKALQGASDDVVEKDALLAKMREALDRIVNDGCGCRPKCVCFSESHLKIWREEIIGIAKEALSLFTSTPQPKPCDWCSPPHPECPVHGSPAAPQPEETK